MDYPDELNLRDIIKCEAYKYWSSKPGHVTVKDFEGRRYRITENLLLKILKEDIRVLRVVSMYWNYHLVE